MGRVTKLEPDQIKLIVEMGILLGTKKASEWLLDNAGIPITPSNIGYWIKKKELP